MYQSEVDMKCRLHILYLGTFVFVFRRAEYRLKFQEYDTDGDGFVSPEEAFNVLKDVLGFTEEKTKILIQQFDTNEDGKLSYEEFVGFYMNVQQK